MNQSCLAVLPAGVMTCPACGTDLTGEDGTGAVDTAQTSVPSTAGSTTQDDPDLVSAGSRADLATEPTVTERPAVPETAGRAQRAVALSRLFRAGLWVVVVLGLLLGIQAALGVIVLGPFSSDLSGVLLAGGLGLWGLVMRMLPISDRPATGTIIAAGIHRQVTCLVGTARGVRKTRTAPPGSTAPPAAARDEFIVEDVNGRHHPLTVQGLDLPLWEGDTVVVGSIGSRVLFYYIDRLGMNYYFPRRTPWASLVRGVKGTALFLWLGVIGTLWVTFLTTFHPSFVSSMSSLQLDETQTLILLGVLVALLIACPITRAINNRRVLRAVSRITATVLGRP